jgi:hypothetical protein
MGINDPYDRSGQYSDGDRGPKVEGYGATAPDRRDHAIGTMVGDGYNDNRQGYGAVLDAIENRIEAVGRFNGRGENGFYGRTKNGETLDSDQTLESIVTARTKGTTGAAQFSNWSKANKEAYGITQRAAAGTPRGPVEQGWYDQALSVYDDYYDPQLGTFRGVAQGGTYYQNKAALSKAQAGPQVAMQREFGALPVGVSGHVVTGPGLHAFGRNQYDPAAPEQIAGQYGEDYGIGTAWNDPIMGRPAAAEFTGTDDPMAPDAYGYATPTDELSGGWGDDLGGFDYTDVLGDFDDFVGTADPMADDAYGPATADYGFDPMAPDAYGAAYADGFDDPLSPDAYGPAYGEMDIDPMQPDAYGPATASYAEQDPMEGSAYGPATAPATADAMAPESYGPATATGQLTDPMGTAFDYEAPSLDLSDDFGFGRGFSAGSFGTGTAPQGWGVTPSAPAAPAPSKPETKTVTETVEVANPAYAEWSNKVAKGRAPETAVPSMTRAPAQATGTLGQYGSLAFGISGFAGMPTPAATKKAVSKPARVSTPAPPKTITKQVSRQVTVPAKQVAQVAKPAVQQPVRQTVQQPSVPFGRVGGFGDPEATTMRQDRTVADNHGAYGGKDAFGPNDPFGGMGFRGPKGTDYADVVDSFDQGLGITRTVKDKRGNVVDQRTVNMGRGPTGGPEFTVDGVRADGRGTADTGMGGDQGSLGDGSYSESSGYNDNSPQGIL